jgi:hypothetical protein
MFINLLGSPIKLYFGYKIKKMRWAGHVAGMREGGGAYSYMVLEEKPGGKRHRWDDDIKLDLKEK